MIKKIRNWFRRREINQVIQYAGAQHALCLAYGDEARARRLAYVIDELECELANLK